MMDLDEVDRLIREASEQRTEAWSRNRADWVRSIDLRLKTLARIRMNLEKDAARARITKFAAQRGI